MPRFLSLSSFILLTESDAEILTLIMSNGLLLQIIKLRSHGSLQGSERLTSYRSASGYSDARYSGLWSFAGTEIYLADLRLSYRGKTEVVHPINDASRGCIKMRGQGIGTIYEVLFHL